MKDELDMPLDERAGPAGRRSERQRTALVDGALEDAAFRLSLDDELGPAKPLTHARATVLVEQALARSRPALQSIASTRVAPTPLAVAQDDEPVKTATRGRWVAWAAAAALLLAAGVTLTRKAPVAGYVVEDPNTLFARAENLEAAGDPRGAYEVYSSIADRHPESASRARLAMGGLLLDSLSDPAGAARTFESLAARDDAWTPDALFGWARAARALRDPATEARVLKRLLAEHASSAHAAYAKARLQQLP